MEGKGSLNEEIAAEVEAMLADGTLEGYVSRLRKDFPALQSEASAAVSHAVEKVIQRPDRPRDLGHYVAASAYNYMRRHGKRRARIKSLDALAAGSGSPSWEPEDEAWTVEEQALLRDTYDELRKHVETWETANVRVVTLLYLEAAFEGEPLPAETAAELAGDILGENVTEHFVRTWKSRGFERLREHVRASEQDDQGWREQG